MSSICTLLFLVCTRHRVFHNGSQVFLKNKYNNWGDGIRKLLRNIDVFLCLRYNSACMWTRASTVNIFFVYNNYISISHKQFNNQLASVQILIYKFQFDYKGRSPFNCMQAVRFFYVSIFTGSFKNRSIDIQKRKKYFFNYLLYKIEINLK